MSDNYDNTNSGALFKNDKKEKESQPDYKGSINVGGVDYWISSWINTSKAGVKYMALKVNKKEASGAQQQEAKKSGDDSFDDDIPF